MMSEEPENTCCGLAEAKNRGKLIQVLGEDVCENPVGMQDNTSAPRSDSTNGENHKPSVTGDVKEAAGA